MKPETVKLLKYFASFFRNLAGGTESTTTNPIVLRYVSRKDLIGVIKQHFDGTLPKDLNIAEMENQELLDIISSELAIIAFILSKWSQHGIPGQASSTSRGASSRSENGQKKKPDATA